MNRSILTGAGSVLAVESFAELKALYERTANRRRVYPLGSRLLEFAALASLRWQNGTLQYSEVRGGLVSTVATDLGQVGIASLVSGRASVQLNGRSFLLEPGDSLIYVPGDTAIQSLQDSSQFSLRLDVSRESLFLLTNLSQRGRSAIPRRLPREVSEDMVRLFEFTYEEFNRVAEREDRTSQIDALGKAIIERVDLFLASIVSPTRSTSKALLNTCLTAVDFVHQNLDRPISTRDIADAAGCSIRTLYRAFDAVGDTTPRDYMTRARVIQGRSLVFNCIDSKSAISEVVCRSGFQTTKSFLHAYITEFGVHPGEEIARDRKILDELGSTVDSS